MKVFRYEIGLSDDMDRDYEKTGIIVSENKETAAKEVYSYYDKKTTDYVEQNVYLEEIDTSKVVILED